MAKINTYPVETPTVDDLLIGTNGSDGKTKNFSIAGVIALADADPGGTAAALVAAEAAARAAADVLLAPLASPAFSGAPTAPTPVSATDSTQLATTAFVHALLTALINASPATLDTLKELADAIGDDPNFAATVAASVAARLAKAANLSDLTDVGAARDNLGVAIGSQVQRWDADLDSLAALTTTAFGRSLLEAATAAAARALTNTAPAPVVTDFLINGSYTLPTGATFVRLLAQGGGGGGGAGAREPTGTAGGGGGGGGGGGLSDLTYSIAELGGAGAGLTIAVAGAAAGGAAQGSNGTVGAGGTAGNHSIVTRTSDSQTLIIGVGGAGGGGGTTAPGGAGGAGQYSTFFGGGGGTTSTSATAAAGSSANMAAGGGGAGGGIDTSNVARAGGNGSYGARAMIPATGAPTLPAGGAATGGTGGAGIVTPVGITLAGSGGAGGGANTSGAGGTGGAGAVYGAGGGGGGAGAAGYARIIVW